MSVAQDCAGAICKDDVGLWLRVALNDFMNLVETWWHASVKRQLRKQRVTPQPAVYATAAVAWLAEQQIRRSVIVT